MQVPLQSLCSQLQTFASKLKPSFGELICAETMMVELTDLNLLLAAASEREREIHYLDFINIFFKFYCECDTKYCKQ